MLKGIPIQELWVLSVFCLPTYLPIQPYFQLTTGILDPWFSQAGHPLFISHTLSTPTPKPLPNHSMPSFCLFKFYLPVKFYPLVKAKFKSYFAHKAVIYYSWVYRSSSLIVPQCSLLRRTSLFSNCFWGFLFNLFFTFQFLSDRNMYFFFSLIFPVCLA